MITALRHFLVDSWLGRVIAFAVFASFVVLGGTFFGMSGGKAGLSGDVVVQIGSHNVMPRELQQAIQRQIAYVIQQGGGSLDILKSPQAKEEIGRSALRNLIIAHEAEMAGQRSGLIPSDDAIRAVVFAMPEFHDPSGRFDAQKMEQLLQANQLDHRGLIEQTRRMLYAGATMFGFGQSAQAPAAEVNWLVNYLAHGRLVDMVRIPFSMGEVTAQPSDAELKRYYQNHLWAFRQPEYRHARLVVMTAGSVAKTVQLSDADLQEAYKAKMQDPVSSTRYNAPELRSIEVLTTSDEATAQQVATAWRGGRSWDALQKRYPKAIPASLNDARLSDLPDPAMGKAAFALAEPGVSSPVHTAAGWSVVHVLSITPAHHAQFESMKEELREEIANARAVPLLKEREHSFEEAVAGSVSLDQIPADIGAFPLAGTMDEHGNLQSGEPAPLPGDGPLRNALIQQVFSQSKGEPPHVVTQPDGSAFAVLVDDIIPAKQPSYEEVRQAVSEAWKKDAQKHVAEQRTTVLYQQAKAKGLRQALEGQAEASLLQKDEHFSHLQQRQDVPELILRAALQQKIGQTAMLETGDGYWLVNVTGNYDEAPMIVHALQQKVPDQLNGAYRNDVSETLGMAYTQAEPPRHFNAALFNQINDRVFSSISGRLAQQ